MSFSKRFGAGVALALALSLSACNRSEDAGNVNALDAALTGNGANDADPALTTALADQIMVDPALAQQSNRNAIRTPDAPASAPIPPDTAPGGPQPAPATGTIKAPPATPTTAATGEGTTLGALAAAQASGPVRAGPKDCTRGLRFSTEWAARLPADLPVYPGGRVTEGAGNDTAGCPARVVSFVSDAPLQTILDWYHTKAVRAGYSAEHQVSRNDHILAGTRASDDSAFYLLLAPQGRRTEVDIITSAGR